MSYDILAFDPKAVTDADFLTWWDEQAEWAEDHSYEDPAVATPELRAFYNDMRQVFPSLGPDVPTDDDSDGNPDLAVGRAEYTFGTSLVYACFRWGAASEARTTFIALAAKHGVAVALVSDDCSILRPA